MRIRQFGVSFFTNLFVKKITNEKNISSFKIQVRRWTEDDGLGRMGTEDGGLGGVNENRVEEEGIGG